MREGHADIAGVSGDHRPNQPHNAIGHPHPIGDFIDETLIDLEGC
jgi:hypothetical protein